MTTSVDRTVRHVVLDFLASAPTPEEIVAYRLPHTLQEREHLLLDKFRSDLLSPEERLEMDEYSQIDHLLTLVQMQARLKLRIKSK
jgi:hypothetical protein